METWPTILAVTLLLSPFLYHPSLLNYWCSHTFWQMHLHDFSTAECFIWLHWFYTSMSFPGQSHFWNSLIFPGFPRPWESQKQINSPAGLFISTETILLGPWVTFSHAFCFLYFFSGPAPPWTPKYSNCSSRVGLTTLGPSISKGFKIRPLFLRLEGQECESGAWTCLDT